MKINIGMKSGNPVSNEEERIERISKRSVEEKILIKENWNRKKLHEGADVLFYSSGAFMSLKQGSSDELGRVMIGTERGEVHSGYSMGKLI